MANEIPYNLTTRRVYNHKYLKALQFLGEMALRMRGKYETK